MTELRIARTRGGRSYDYKDGMVVPRGWQIRTKAGEMFDTIEEHDEVMAKRAAQAKQRVANAKRAATKAKNTEG